MEITADRHLRADARRNRERLLAAADEAFRRDGVTASLEGVARAAGVGMGTLYRHFPTREDIIAALVHADLEEVAAFADRLVADASPGGLERWLERLVAHTVIYRGLADTVVAATGTATAFGAACTRVHTAGAELVRSEQQRGAVRDDVEADDVIDLANAVAWVTEDDRTTERRRRLLRIGIDGLQARRDGSVSGT